MTIETSPDRIYALVVGIEKYDAGLGWDLNGPANDIYQFTKWLRAHNVPDQNPFLFLSPLDKNMARLSQLEIAFQPATQALIYDTITNILPQLEGDLLFIFWGGHGMITPSEDRKLFYADAVQQDLRNLDFEALRACLKTDLFLGLTHQIMIVDACANYVQPTNLIATLPHQTFPQGSPSPRREQFILLSAKSGEYARNLAEDNTGQFSQAFLSHLTQASPRAWPPDMPALAKQLQDHFNQLRAAGKSNQTPIHFSYRDWDGNGASLGQFVPTSKSPTPSLSGGLTQLDLRKKAKLADVLLACPSIRDQESRNTLIYDLRWDIAVNIRRHNSDRMHVMHIINTCLNYVGGLQELIDVITLYEGPDAIPVIELREFQKNNPPKSGVTI